MSAQRGLAEGAQPSMQPYSAIVRAFYTLYTLMPHIPVLMWRDTPTTGWPCLSRPPTRS